MRGLRMLGAVVVLVVLVAGCGGDGRYELTSLTDPNVICRLDTRTGEVVCAGWTGNQSTVALAPGPYFNER